MIGRSRWVRGAALGVALALSAARGAEADARRDYLDGLLAYREGRLAEAVTALERAAAERPREEARARLVGAIPQPYLPWHYLGLVLARQGRCDEASRALERSAADGAAARFPDRLRELETARLACPPARADLVSEPTAPPAPSATSASQPPPIPFEAPAAGLAPAAEVDRKVPGTLPEPEVTAEQVPAAEQVPGTSSKPRPAKPPLPRFLEEAADRFSEGDYRGTLAALETVPTDGPPRERALADLLIAAASFSLHELGGRSESALLEQATAAARRTRATAPDLHPDATVFAPRFVDWFESLR